MPTVKFTSIDKAARTATFDVDGQSVTRNIPAQYAGTIDDYLNAVAEGLVIEFTVTEVKPIEDTLLKAGDIVVDAVKE